jgi:hypothetical protein
VHLFHLSLSFLAEPQPRLEISEHKRYFLAEVHIKFFRRPHELQSKKHHCKNYKFILYLPFQILVDSFLIHIKFFL